MYQVDEVLYINENKVVIYLVDRQFTVETNKGNALALVRELLFPYFERLKLKSEEHTQVIKVAA